MPAIVTKDSHANSRSLVKCSNRSASRSSRSCCSFQVLRTVCFRSGPSYRTLFSDLEELAFNAEVVAKYRPHLVGTITGLMSQHAEFIVTELGKQADPFVLHIFAALAEKER